MARAHHKNKSGSEPGWYIFQDGKVIGPVSVQDAIKNVETNNGANDTFVSRVGFKNWYPADRLKQIYSDVRQIEGKYATASKEFEKHLTTNLDKLERMRSSHAKKAKSSMVSGPASSPQVLRKQIRGDSDLPSPRASTKSQRKHQAHRAKKSPVTTEQKASYLTLKGQLRLGTPMKPLQIAFIDYLLSLGFNWGPWYYKVCDEAAYHLSTDLSKVAIKNKWLIWIPIVHFVKCYQLSRTVRNMELQNGYQSTSPLVAGILSVIPSAFMYYIQSKLTLHWQLHVANVRKD